ncbi:hypothetical protein GGF32_008521 [Allomyces javanicus]|nr:hypothetical protein GGF32_008521 [Allomyces javanicus]
MMPYPVHTSQLPVYASQYPFYASPYHPAMPAWQMPPVREPTGRPSTGTGATPAVTTAVPSVKLPMPMTVHFSNGVTMTQEQFETACQFMGRDPRVSATVGSLLDTRQHDAKGEVPHEKVGKEEEEKAHLTGTVDAIGPIAMADPATNEKMLLLIDAVKSNPKLAYVEHLAIQDGMLEWPKGDRAFDLKGIIKGDPTAPLDQFVDRLPGNAVDATSSTAGLTRFKAQLALFRYAHLHCTGLLPPAHVEAETALGVDRTKLEAVPKDAGKICRYLQLAAKTTFGENWHASVLDLDSKMFSPHATVTSASGSALAAAGVAAGVGALPAPGVTVPDLTPSMAAAAAEVAVPPIVQPGSHPQPEDASPTESTADAGTTADVASGVLETHVAAAHTRSPLPALPPKAVLSQPGPSMTVAPDPMPTTIAAREIVEMFAHACSPSPAPPSKAASPRVAGPEPAGADGARLAPISAAPDSVLVMSDAVETLVLPMAKLGAHSRAQDGLAIDTAAVSPSSFPLLETVSDTVPAAAVVKTPVRPNTQVGLEPSAELVPPTDSPALQRAFDKRVLVLSNKKRPAKKQLVVGDAKKSRAVLGPKRVQPLRADLWSGMRARSATRKLASADLPI